MYFVNPWIFYITDANTDAPSVSWKKVNDKTIHLQCQLFEWENIRYHGNTSDWQYNWLKKENGTEELDIHDQSIILWTQNISIDTQYACQVAEGNINSTWSPFIYAHPSKQASKSGKEIP